MSDYSEEGRTAAFGRRFSGPDKEEGRFATGGVRFVVIAYDVVDDRRRHRIFKALKNHGRHVQYSVFECDLDPKVIARLQKKLARLINAEEDNIRFYFLDRDAISRIQEIGRSRGPAMERLAHFVIL